jgi:arsenate reductase-like glutaredoxin family protein
MKNHGLTGHMKREYDFSRAVRGKFFRKGAELHLPVYVESETRKRLERIAKKTGKPVTQLINQLLKKDVELLEVLT